jgi:hypothetical protein
VIRFTKPAILIHEPTGRTPGKLLRVPDLKPLPWQRKGPYVEFRVDALEVFQMAILEYV